MATLLAHITVKPGQEAAFEAVCRTLHAHSHAKDPGLLRYEYWRSTTPRLYYALLAFEDYRAFMVHQTSDHHEAAVPELGKTIETLRLEWIDPLPGGSDLPPTREQALAPDASPLARRYGESIPVEVAQWWGAITR